MFTPKNRCSTIDNFKNILEISTTTNLITLSYKSDKILNRIYLPNYMCNHFFPLKVECREIFKKEQKFNFFFFKKGGKRYFCSKYSQK